MPMVPAEHRTRLRSPSPSTLARPCHHHQSHRCIVTPQTNITISGKATDALSGVASVQAAMGSGAFVPVTFDASGSFQFTTGLALNRSARRHPWPALPGHRQRRQQFDALRIHPADQPPVTPAFQLDPTANTGTTANPVTTAGVVTLIGHTDPNVTVTLDGPTFQTISSNTGTFQFANVPLSLGTTPSPPRPRTWPARRLQPRRSTASRRRASRTPVVVWNQAAPERHPDRRHRPAVCLRAPGHGAGRGLRRGQRHRRDARAMLFKMTAPAGASAKPPWTPPRRRPELPLPGPAEQPSTPSWPARSARCPTARRRPTAWPWARRSATRSSPCANDGSNTFVDFIPGTARATGSRRRRRTAEAARPAVGQPDAVGHDQPEPVPPGRAAGPDSRPVGRCRQRGREPGQRQQHDADGRPDADRPVLERRSRHLHAAGPLERHRRRRSPSSRATAWPTTPACSPS